MKLGKRGGLATAAAPAATTAAAPRGTRVRDRWLEATFLAGLAGVFLSNAVTALLQPRDFTDLVEQSVIVRWLDLPTGSWLSLVIFVNDLMLGVALLASVWVRRIRLRILAWAGFWLFAVTAVRATSLEVFS